MIDPAEIRARVALLDLIGETVRLKKQGAQHYGLCPFHADKSPTLRVDPKKGVWHCPSCQIGGDIFSWLKHRDGIPFRQAINDLAVRAGIDAKAPRSPQDAPLLPPPNPRFPMPRHAPSLPWGGQHLLSAELVPVHVLTEFPGRRAYLRLAETVWPGDDILWWPAPWATAERMYLAPIAGRTLQVERGPTLADRYRADALIEAVQAFRSRVRLKAAG